MQSKTGRLLALFHISLAHLIPLAPIIPLLGRRTPRKCPLDAIGDSKDDDCADEDADDVGSEDGAFGGIEERVDVESLRRVRHVRQTEVHP